MSFFSLFLKCSIWFNVSPLVAGFFSVKLFSSPNLGLADLEMLVKDFVFSSFLRIECMNVQNTS